jgi:hypothetical protein
MRIAFPFNSWSGGFVKSIQNACDKLGHETFMLQEYNADIINKIARRSLFGWQKVHAVHVNEMAYNNDLIRQLVIIKPDIFFNKSGSGLFPETVKIIKEKIKCIIICLIGDNPCDPHPKRDKYFAASLQYYDVLLNPEPIWNKIIRNLAPKAKVIKFFGGYEPENYFLINKGLISKEEKLKYTCDVSFTGDSYQSSPEGAYRAGILGQLNDFNVKIWGDIGWTYRFQFYTSLKESFQGNRLSYEELRKLYSFSTINLNIPSPQIFTSFQPRVFEIAATKGFQIIDHSDELYNIFDENDVVTFKGINDLKNKIDFYKRNEKERNRISEAMYTKVINRYSWEKQIQNVLGIL